MARRARRQGLAPSSWAERVVVAAASEPASGPGAAPTPGAELTSQAALEEAVALRAELVAVGRNLNQITRRLHAVADPLFVQNELRSRVEEVHALVVERIAARLP